jgi:type I restriction enzyme S subunit
MKESSLVPLSSIAHVISGFAFKSTWFGVGREKVVRISDLVDGKVSLANAVTFDATINKVSSRYQIQEGDVLVALSGATVGKVGIALVDAEGAFLNQRVAIVRGHTKVNTEYLSYLLRSSYMQNLLPSAGGAAQPNLSPKLLESLPIPNPHSLIKTKVGAHLKAQLAEVGKALKAAEKQLGETTTLANAIVRDSINLGACRSESW